MEFSRKFLHLSSEILRTTVLLFSLLVHPERKRNDIWSEYEQIMCGNVGRNDWLLEAWKQPPGVNCWSTSLALSVKHQIIKSCCPCLVAYNLEWCALFAAVPQLAVISSRLRCDCGQRVWLAFWISVSKVVSPPSIFIYCLELSPLHCNTILWAGPSNFQAAAGNNVPSLTSSSQN